MGGAADMRLLRVWSVVAALSGLWAQPGLAQSRFGAQGAEAAPDRRQVWSVPTPSSGTAARAILYRPPGEGPFPLAVIAHATTQNPLRRAQMPQPDYPALAGWLVARGYAVLVPERPGHGATGGRYLEDQGGCDDANYLNAGRATAQSIALAMDYLRSQDFVRQGGTLIIGHSAGGLGALALAGQNLLGVAAIVAFAPGRGGHAHDRPNQICAPQALVAAVGDFGRQAHVPVVWLVTRNDSYFAPEFSRQMAEAFRGGGGKVDFRVLPEFRGEGHFLAESDGGDEIYGATLDSALKPLTARPARKR